MNTDTRFDQARRIVELEDIVTNVYRYVSAEPRIPFDVREHIHALLVGEGE